jgi:endonuclease/exonuclease/phosphatase family metal-dependent hydrolase
MRKSLLLCIILAGIYNSNAQVIRIMTYNIRYATVNDGDNQWEQRKDFLSDQISFQAADIFGIQEGLGHQVDYLAEQRASFKFIGVGRDDGVKKGEYCAIFYNMEKFDLLGQNTFWLSTTPEEVSVGWDAAMERICTYGFFMDKASGTMFWVFNTHFDHIGELAREKSAQLLVQKIKEVNKDDFPVILMGDFNLNDQSKPIRYLSAKFNDSRDISLNRPFGPFGTFNEFKFHEPVQDRIDYIFCSKENIQVQKYAVLTDSKDSKYPSDHFPVLVEFRFKE